jgi:hypothetical protein
MEAYAWGSWPMLALMRHTSQSNRRLYITYRRGGGQAVHRGRRGGAGRGSCVSYTGDTIRECQQSAGGAGVCVCVGGGVAQCAPPWAWSAFKQPLFLRATTSEASTPAFYISTVGPAPCSD